jgi:hypothetical protein
MRISNYIIKSNSFKGTQQIPMYVKVLELLVITSLY